LKRILFVDDESKILDGLRRMMYTEQKRWDMQFAQGGEAALHACETSTFDVVVSDMRMPGMDGATLLSLIRDRYPSTARIILSGYSDGSLTSRALSVAHRFLAKPCNPLELQSAIERVFALQEVLAVPEIRAVVSGIGELPSLSSTYASLMQAVKDPNSSVNRVSEIIGHDVAMSAKVLQLVNSAFYGLAQKVTTVQNATAYLGMETIRNLALASEVFRVFQPNACISQEICASMQYHAERTAAIAAALPIDPKTRDLTLMAALLHDTGSLILACKMPDVFCSVRALVQKRGCRPFEAELELLGTSHAEIGAYLLGLWGISSHAIEAIAHHHQPTRIPHSGFDSSIAVYVADLLAHNLSIQTPGSKDLELEPSDRACLETLGILDRFPEFCELVRHSHH
jgi:HD-like signal output (HDOD) protein/CheY-like chemotaxis protein